MRLACSTMSFLDNLPENVKLPYRKGATLKIVLGGKEDAYDDMRISASLIEFKDEYYYWVTIDTGIIRPIICDIMYEQICNYTSCLKKENLIITATHTHSCVLYTKFDYKQHDPRHVETRDNVYVDVIEHWGNIAGMLFCECEAKLTEFEADIKVVEIEGCYGNIDGDDKPCDKNFSLIRFFKKGTKEIIGMWMNMACHALVMFCSAQKITSDLVGGVAKKLEAYYHVYPQASLGCQGDTHPGSSLWNEQKDLKKLEQLSSSIAKQVITKGVFEPIVIDWFEVQRISLTYFYEVGQEETRKRYEALLQERDSLPEEERGRYTGNIRIQEQRIGATKFEGILDSMAINLGEVKLALFNGELLNELGMELVRHESHDHWLIVGYVNSEAGYLTPRDEGCWPAKSRIIPLGLPNVLVNLVKERLKSFGDEENGEK